MTTIPTQAQYHANEMSRLARHLQQIENAPLLDRKEARKDWAEALQKYPDLITQRLGWLFNGSYGYGAMVRAREIAGNKRANRAAALGLLIAALEWQCPADFARSEFRKLPAEQQEALNAAIIKAADDSLIEEN